MTTSRTALLGFLLGSCLLTFAQVTAPHAQDLPFRLAHSGRPLKVTFAYDIDAACQSHGRTAIAVVAPPANGAITVQNASEFPNAALNTPSSACNRRRVPGTSVYYTANRGYAGPDAFTVQIQFPTGFVRNRRFDIVVQ